MALVQARLQASILDASNLRASLEMPCVVSDATALTAIPTYWTGTFLPALEGIMGGQVKGGGFTLVLPPSATAGRPQADSRIQEIGVFDEGNANDQTVFGIPVNTILDSVLTVDKRQVDNGNAAVIAWRALLLAAILGGNFTNRQYEVLTKNLSTLRTFRKYSHRSRPVGRNTG